MAVQLALFVAFLALGVALQLRGHGDSLRARLWLASFWVLGPLVVFFTFLRLAVGKSLLLALAAAILASWIVIGLSFAYAHRVASDRDEQGALGLGAAFGNTGFLGYPLAVLAFGQRGLALAVLYDLLGMLFPMTSITTAFARLYGRSAVDVGGERRLRAILLNPPVWALPPALLLRAGHVHVPGTAPAFSALAHVVGPVGFLLLGLSLPLERIEHGAQELARAAGVFAIRFGVSPLVLLATGRLLGADVPDVFYLTAAMPCAFHLLVLARVYEMRPALVRLLVVGSTIPGVIAVVFGAALLK